MDSDAHLLSTVRDVLQRKNNQFTSIILDIDKFPGSYYYHEETAHYRPDVQDYHPVIECEAKPLFTNCTSFWRELKENAQDKLYYLLWSARRISHRVIFDCHFKVWSIRRPPLVGHPMELMKTYGYLVRDDGDIQTGPDVLKNLGRGRSPQEIKQTLMNIRNVLSYNKLEDVWQLALTAGMTNGLGRVAVYVLLDHITGLLDGLNAKELFGNPSPKIAILNVTSSTANDGFPIVSSPSPRLTRSCTSSSAPSSPEPTLAAKRRKVSESPTPGGSGDFSPVQMKSAAEEKVDRRRVLTWPSHNCQYVDLSVVCMDDTSGVAKYLFLIEIHSRGISLRTAKSKFMSEIIHVLQGQDFVFGLFFRAEEVLLITANKKQRWNHLFQ